MARKMTPEEKAIQEEKDRQIQKINKKASEVINFLKARGSYTSSRFQNSHGCPTIEVPANIFDREIRGNLSVYFNPSTKRHDIEAKIEGYLQFGQYRVAVYIPPESQEGIQSVLGLNKSSL